MSRPTKRTSDRVAADPQLQQQVVQAEAVAEHSLVECIKRAGEVDWRAAAWLLERRNPAAWSIRYQQELLIRNTTTEPVKVIVEYVDYAAQAKLLE